MFRAEVCPAAKLSPDILIKLLFILLYIIHHNAYNKAKAIYCTVQNVPVISDELRNAFFCLSEIPIEF